MESIFADLNFTDITNAVNEIVPQVIVPILTVQGAVIGLKLLKKFTGKIG